MLIFICTFINKRVEKREDMLVDELTFNEIHNVFYMIEIHYIVKALDMEDNMVIYCSPNPLALNTLATFLQMATRGLSMLILCIRLYTKIPPFYSCFIYNLM